ncbi:unnamed protein product [Rhizophagus irregularis]|nr:unnamed protein product [Rhizophagus irregularis]
MGAIIIRIFKTEEKEHPNFILQLIRQPNQILGYSERLNIINRCFDINKLNTMMTTLTSIGALYNNNIQPLQRIASIALLKEFRWYIVSRTIEYNNEITHPLINAFKLYLLRELRINKEFSTDDIKKFCEAQSNINWFSNLDLDDKEECRLPFNPYWAISDYGKLEIAYTLLYNSNIRHNLMNFQTI